MNKTVAIILSIVLTLILFITSATVYILLIEYISIDASIATIFVLWIIFGAVASSIYQSLEKL